MPRTSVGFTYVWDPGTTPKAAAVLMPLFHAALIRNLKNVAAAIVADVQDRAVKLQPEHVPYDLIPGGRDSNTMADSLIATLAESLTNVSYIFSSASAPYWEYVEFGHMVRGGSWWDGYHFFGNAIDRHKESVIAAARLSWAEAVLGTRATLGIANPTRITSSVISLLSART